MHKAAVQCAPQKLNDSYRTLDRRFKCLGLVDGRKIDVLVCVHRLQLGHQNADIHFADGVVDLLVTTTQSIQAQLVITGLRLLVCTSADCGGAATNTVVAASALGHSRTLVFNESISPVYSETFKLCT